MTRLVIGGVEVGLSKLLKNLERWDQGFANQESQENQESQDIVTEVLEGEVIVSADSEIPAEPADEFSQTHYALVGLVFEAQDTLFRGIEMLDRTSQMVIRRSEPWLRPVRESRFVKPISRQVDKLAERGQKEVMRWVERGRMESTHGRKMAETAISTTVDHSIEFLTTNTEVQELVQQQSTGLANEVLEEVRERTVSADNFLEGLARRVLRRIPRQQLPEPPLEVIQRAAPIRPPKGKGIPK